MAVTISEHARERLAERGYLPAGTPAERLEVDEAVRRIAEHGRLVGSGRGPQRRVGCAGGRLTVVLVRRSRGRRRVETVFPANHRIRRDMMRAVFARSGWTPPLAA